MRFLHFNRSNGIFTVRRSDRTIMHASKRHAGLPLIGTVESLAPRVYLLITRSDYLSAMRAERPRLKAVVTTWPRVHLLVKWIKEMF